MEGGQRSLLINDNAKSRRAHPTRNRERAPTIRDAAWLAFEERHQASVRYQTTS